MSKIYAFIKDNKIESRQGCNLFTRCSWGFNLLLKSVYDASVCGIHLDETDPQFFFNLADAKSIPKLSDNRIYNNGKIIEMDVDDETHQIKDFCKLHTIVLTTKNAPVYTWIERNIALPDISKNAISYMNDVYYLSRTNDGLIDNDRITPRF